jgi:hypothetical protein
VFCDAGNVAGTAVQKGLADTQSMPWAIAFFGSKLIMVKMKRNIFFITIIKFNKNIN